MISNSILWADDEIDLLKPHVMFLEQKGYKVSTVTNGNDALEEAGKNNFDLVFLDENMPGLSGLETLSRLKEQFPNLPVVMITKSEEESIMEDAIGSKIADYLIKPVNPNQILLCIKKNLDKKRLINEKTNVNYQQEFRNIGMRLSDNLSYEEWCEMYKKIVYWDMELSNSSEKSMTEILAMQKQEANQQFYKFVQKNYISWLNGKVDDKPIFSHTLVKEKVLPAKKENQPLWLMVIDNLRYDQWLIIKPALEELYKVTQEELYMGILPTATQYARNSLFAGLLPSEIERLYPNLWIAEGDEEHGRNENEEELFNLQLKRLGKNFKTSYNKITNHQAGKKLVDHISSLQNNDVNVIVYNFVDMLSHSRTDMEVIRELAEDENAYRSLTQSWFSHSPLLDIFKKIASLKGNVVITTDHGTCLVTEPTKVQGDKNTNTNLRYKQGKTLSYNAKEVFEVKNPKDVFLPRVNVSSTYLFAKPGCFFAYPNNYNHYTNYYKNTFQHGGISLEEMLIPIVFLNPK